MTAHADICSRLLSEADFYDSDASLGIPPSKKTVISNYLAAAALIQQMAGELAQTKKKVQDILLSSPESDKAKIISLRAKCLFTEQRAESAESRADDAHLSCIAAEEERELLRKKNIDNCLQITALQEALMQAESRLADLRAKLAAADSGMPKPDVMLHVHENGHVVNLHYIDKLRTLATAQAVRIAEGNSETRRLFEALKNIAAFGEDAGGALRYDKNCFLLLNIANAALQLAAKHD